MNQDWLTVFEALRSVYSEEAYSNMAVNEAISHHKGCRDSFVRNMTKGVLRDTVQLDYLADKLASGGIRSIRRRPLIIIRMGLYALRSLDSVPDHAAVNEAVELSRKAARGNDRFINAVLRSYIRRKDELEESISSGNAALRYSFPDPVADLISSQYGDEAEQIMAGLNSPPPVVLRVNTLRVTRKELADELKSEGIQISPAAESERALIAEGGRILGSESYRKGLFTIQSLSSIMAVEALNPSPGSKILDMCAAPGGKTTMMAEMMGGTGDITACDIHPHRLELIEASAARLGISCIRTRLLDGTEFDPSMENMYDYVLADVPCSGLGVIGTKPEIRLRTDPGRYDELYEVQLSILQNAVRYARPGGIVEYSTCTINRNENERIVYKMAENFSLASILEMHSILPYNNLVGFYYCIIKKDAEFI